MRFPVLFLILALVPAVAHAALTLEIQEGTTTVRSYPATNTPLFFLSCALPPCTQDIGSFRFQDISSTNRARVVKTDGASVDKLEVKGLKVTSLAAGKTLRIIYATGATDFAATLGGSYPYTAILTGSFTGPNGTGAASACTDPSVTFCVRATLTANGNQVNLDGSETVATVSVPPISTLSGAFPTGLTDTESIQCGTTGVAGSCQPTLSGRVIARFDRTGEILTLPGSATAAGSRKRTQEEGEVAYCDDAELAVKLACANRYIAFSAATEHFEFRFSKPEGDTRNVNNASEIPFAATMLRRTALAPAASLPLLAIGNPGAGLTDADVDVSSRAFLALVMSDKLRDLDSVSYTFTVDTSSGFSDCQNSLYVRIDVVESDGETPVGSARVLLGAAANPATGCSGAGLSGVNLVLDLAARVDTAALPNGCSGAEQVGALCLRTFREFQTKFGSQNRRVRRISLVLERVTGIDQKVDVASASIDGIVFSPTAPVLAETCDFPDGLGILVTKLTGTGAGQSFAFPSTEHPTPVVENNGCQARIHVNNLLIEPEGTTEYMVQGTVNGRTAPEAYHFTLR